MNREETRAGYGFAPHGRPVDKSMHGSAAPSRPLLAESIVPIAHYEAPAPALSRANLAWLCIGVLLGSGVALLGSSFWLQGSYVNPSVAMATDPSTLTDPAAIDDGLDAAILEATPSTGEAGLPRVVADERDAGDVELEDETVLVSVREVEAPADIEEPAEEQATRLSEKPSNDLTARAEADDASSSIAAAKVVQQRVTEARERARAVLANDVLGQREAELGSTRQVADVRDPETSDRGDDEVLAEGSAPREDTEILLARASQGEPDIAATTEDDLDGDLNGDGESVAEEPAPARRVYRVQLAAVDNENAAETFWREARDRLPAMFSGIEPTFDRGEVDERIFYRIWVGAFEKRTDADDYCGKLKTNGQDCFVTRG